MEHIDHILVVDDDRDIRELIVDYLVKSGYHASGAANGKEMRAVLDKQHIDTVVLDVMMPGDDGLTLCRQPRSSRHKDLPILMLTARNEDSTDPGAGDGRRRLRGQTVCGPRTAGAYQSYPASFSYYAA